MDSLTADDRFDRQFDELPDSVWDDIVETCERFDTDWKEDLRVEDYLAEGDGRGLSLVKLLAIDLEKRLDRGESPSFAAYARRFPADDEILRRSFAAFGLSQHSPGDTATQAIQNTTEDTQQQPDFPDLENYEVLRVIGWGGMGVVYKARQRKPNRIVALKMIAQSIQSSDLINRFHVEADLAAKLDHPNIVSVYEVNDHKGCPFFSMQYVECQSLKELHQHPVKAERAAEYVRTIANAVQHAHEQEVLHRDIKPSNILIDSAGGALLTDFGVAKRIAGESDLTASGQVIGTPSYMPPEQAQGRLEQIDERSDVYSLGAVLYSLLTGHPPFEAASVTETLRQVIHCVPIRPRQTNPTISRDIETICLKCLEKNPQKRYPSARELAADLGRFLSREPIRARPIGNFERTYRWCRRKPAHAIAVAMLAIVFVLFAAFGSYATVAANIEKQLRADADQLREDAEEMQYLAEVGFTSWQYEHLIQEKASPAMARYGAKALGHHGAGYYGPTSVPGGVKSWESAWLEQLAQSNARLQGRLTEGDWGLLDVDTTGDGKAAVSVDESGLMLVWDLATGRVKRRLSAGRWRTTAPTQWLHHYLGREKGSSLADWGACYVDVEWLDDGRIVAASLDGSGTLFNAASGEKTSLIKAKQPLYSVAAGADRILFGDAAGGLSLRSLDGKEQKAVETENQAVTAIRWLPKSEKWVVGFENGNVVVFDAESLKPVAELQVPAPVWSIDATDGDDRAEVAIGCNQSMPAMARLTDKGLELLRSLQRPESGVTAKAIHQVHFAADGSRLFGANDRGYLTQWELTAGSVFWNIAVTGRDERGRALAELAIKQTGKPLPLPFDRRVAAIHEIELEGAFVTAGQDLAIKVWESPLKSGGEPIRLNAQLGEDPQIEFDPRRISLLWAIDKRGVLTLTDTERNAVVAKREAHSGGVPGIAIAKDGLVATVGGDRSIRLWRATKSKFAAAKPKKIDHIATLLSVALTKSGDLVAAVDVEARLGVWRTSNGEQVFLTELHSEMEPGAATSSPRPLTGRVAFSRDGDYLAAFGVAQSGHLFSTRPFKRLDTQIWVAGTGGTAIVWNPIHNNVVFAADDHSRYVTTSINRDFRPLEEQGMRAWQPSVSLKATPDGKRIISLEEGGRLVFMETKLHLQLFEMTHPRHLDSDFSVDESGNRLALAGSDGSVEILEVTAAKRDAAPPRVDRSDRWDAKDLVQPTSLIPRADKRTIRFDSQDRLNMLLVLSRHNDFRNEGELHFLRSDGNSLLRERIVVDGTISDRRVDIAATGLAIDKNAKPLVVFRRRTAEQSPYDGSLLECRRRGAEDWNTSVIHRHGNFGFYPFLSLSADGQLAEVRHFSFSGFTMLQSVRDAASDDWKAQHFGHVGDGLHMEHAQSNDGVVHLLFSWNPINSMPASKMYARYHDGKYLREVVDPYAHVSDLRVTTDGSVFVMARKRDRVCILRRGEDGWREFCKLPDDVTGSFEIISDDEIYCGPKCDAETGEILLWHKDQNGWRLEVIAPPSSGLKPSWLQLLRDHQGRPAVLCGRLGEPYGWIKLLTQ